MTNPTGSSRRVEVWEAMAHHFLDTETRHDIPRTALRSNLSPALVLGEGLFAHRRVRSALERAGT